MSFKGGVYSNVTQITSKLATVESTYNVVLHTLDEGDISVRGVEEIQINTMVLIKRHKYARRSTTIMKQAGWMTVTVSRVGVNQISIA